MSKEKKKVGYGNQRGVVTDGFRATGRITKETAVRHFATIREKKYKKKE